MPGRLSCRRLAVGGLVREDCRTKGFPPATVVATIIAVSSRGVHMDPRACETAFGHRFCYMP